VGQVCLDRLEQGIVVEHTIQLGQHRVQRQTQGGHKVAQMHRRIAIMPHGFPSLPSVMPLGMIARGGERVLHRNLVLDRRDESLL
jgi:hypothetical protein